MTNQCSQAVLKLVAKLKSAKSNPKVFALIVRASKKGFFRKRLLEWEYADDWYNDMEEDSNEVIMLMSYIGPDPKDPRRIHLRLRRHVSYDRAGSFYALILGERDPDGEPYEYKQITFTTKDKRSWRMARKLWRKLIPKARQKAEKLFSNR